LCFRPDGKLIATGENEGRVLVIDVNSRQPLRKFANHKKAVYSLVFGVGSKLVTGSDDLVICQINLIECKSF
jgi:WD40 repeat protein